MKPDAQGLKLGGIANADRRNLAWWRREEVGHDMALKVVRNIIRRIISDPSLNAPELAEFDPIFYRAYYGDLHHLKSAAGLRRHFVKHGRREERWRNWTEARNNFTARFGPLPDDFQTNTYKALNEDLARAFDHEWQFEFHYLEHGQKEGRSYKREGGSPGDPARSWMTVFRLADFVACAQSWLDEIPQTRERGIDIFLDAGIGRLAPINLDLVFDPDFYRTAYGFDDSMTGAALYRHWLETGAPQELPPNEEKALQYIVASRRYPEAFDWKRYKSALPTQEANALRCRVDVLKHLFDTGFEKGLTKHIIGDGSDELFAAIGDYHLIRGHRQVAILAYDRVLALDPSHAGVRQRRGEAYAVLGKAAAAYADFAHAAALPDASVGSTIQLARTAAAIGSFEKSFEILRDARSKWRKSPDYRNAVTDLIEQYFAAKSRSAMALYDAGDREIADAYLLRALDELRGRIAEFEVPAAAIPPSPCGHVAILANQDLSQCRHYRAEQKLRQLRQAGLKAELFDQHNPAPFIRSLLGARAAIFYRVPAFPNIIRAILTAQALGIPTYYEIDDLIFDAASYPDIFESYEGQISKSEYDGLLYGVPLFRYAMGLCEYGIASTTPLARRIEPIVRSALASSCAMGWMNAMTGRSIWGGNLAANTRPSSSFMAQERKLTTATSTSLPRRRCFPPLRNTTMYGS